MRAEISSAVQEASRGAICHAEWKDGRLRVETISGKEPSGICGTGIIEILYCLLEAEIMDETGRLEAPWDSEGFPVDEKGNIRIYQKDIREIQLAKAAVRAGFETLLDEYGISLDEVDEIFLAGGFGYELDIGRAVAIGLLRRAIRALREPRQACSTGRAGRRWTTSQGWCGRFPSREIRDFQNYIWNICVLGRKNDETTTAF